MTANERSERTEVVSGRRGEPAEFCAACGTPRSSPDRFCEACGYDLLDRSVGWSVTITADREFYDRQAPDGVVFPSEFHPRRVRLEEGEVDVGRRSASRDTNPDIDLSGDPEDPGISHRHARLARARDGSYSLIDLGSTNGTMMNDSEDPLEPNRPVPLADGDRVHLGAWTTLLIRVSSRHGIEPGTG